jgi:hypothetical protein
MRAPFVWLVFFYFFPIHDLLEGGAIFISAKCFPLHLVALQALTSGLKKL